MAERLELSGVELAYEDTGGHSPCVIFVHGLGGSKNAWLAQLARARAMGWRAIAYDQRGAGRSAKPPGPYSTEQWADDLVAVVDSLGVETAALVGHSVGSMVAEQAALRLTDRVWALVLCGAALRWRPEAGPVFETRVALAREGRLDEIADSVATTGLSERCRREDPRLLGLMRELIASNDPTAYAECAQATASAEITDPGQVRCPVLALCGSEDPVAPPAAAAAIAAAVPNGRSAAVEGAAHWCAIEDPQGTNRVIFDFLAEIAGG